MQTQDKKTEQKNGNHTAPPTPPAAAASSKPTDNRPPVGETAAAQTEKKRQSSKVYIVVGEVREFKNRAEAEKFLNAPDAPTSFDVIVGKKVEKKQKVSLR